MRIECPPMVPESFIECPPSTYRGGGLKKLDNRNFPPYICNQLLILLLKFLIMVISCVNFNQTGTST